MRKRIITILLLLFRLICSGQVTDIERNLDRENQILDRCERDYKSIISDQEYFKFFSGEFKLIPLLNLKCLKYSLYYPTDTEFRLLVDKVNLLERTKSEYSYLLKDKKFKHFSIKSNKNKIEQMKSILIEHLSLTKDSILLSNLDDIDPTNNAFYFGGYFANSTISNRNHRMYQDSTYCNQLETWGDLSEFKCDFKNSIYFYLNAVASYKNVGDFERSGIKEKEGVSGSSTQYRRVLSVACSIRFTIPVCHLGSINVSERYKVLVTVAKINWFTDNFREDRCKLNKFYFIHTAFSSSCFHPAPKG